MLNFIQVTILGVHMKKIVLFMLMISSTSIFALDNGIYSNLNYTSSDAQMYKSLTLETSTCAIGGAVITFNNADPMDFCIGNEFKSVFKYKKCMGVEIDSFPFKKCIGYKKDAELITTRSIVKNIEDGTIRLYEKNIDDGKVYFEQTYTIDNRGSSEIKISLEFKDFRDAASRSGYEEYIFTKK